MKTTRSCPHCGQEVDFYRNPLPTVDVIIHAPGGGVVLVERANEPHGWALPGGFVDYGESCEAAAVREAREETGLDVTLTRLAGVYSDPERDPRHHTLSVVYAALAENMDRLQAGDDAAGVRVWPLDALPALVFDHARILEDYRRSLPGASGVSLRRNG
ncbi:MAG: NUDIX domain-containing protein [Desulfovibrio sp.]